MNVEMIAHLNNNVDAIMNVRQSDENAVPNQIVDLHSLPTGHPYGDHEDAQRNEQRIECWRLRVRHLGYDEPTSNVGENGTHHPVHEPGLRR